MQSDLHESYYIYFYNYLLRNLREIVDIHHIMKERDVSLVIYCLFFVLHCFADCHCGKKGITNENVIFIYK